MATSPTLPGGSAAKPAEGQPTGSAWRDLPRKVLTFFVAADAAMVAIYVVAGSTAWRNQPVAWALVDLNHEYNIPTWLSAIQLFLVGFGLILLGSRLFETFEPVHRLRRMWIVFGAAFVYFSADEAGVIHERLSQLTAIALGGPKPLSHLLSAGILAHTNLAGHIKGGGLWIPIYMVVGIIGLALLAPQIRDAVRTFPRESLLFITGFAILFGGGVIIEGISGLMRLQGTNALIEVGIEEGFELIGQVIALFGVVSLLAMAAEAVLGVPTSAEGSAGPQGL